MLALEQKAVAALGLCMEPHVSFPADRLCADILVMELPLVYAIFQLDSQTRVPLFLEAKAKLVTRKEQVVR